MSPESPANRANARTIVLACLVFLAFLVLALAVYSPAIDGEFVSDDLRFIANNGANLDSLARPWRFFLDADTIATPPDRDIYRPLRTISFAIDRAIGDAIGCESTRVFHLHNLALHAICAALLLVWLRGISGARHGAIFASLLFLLHPLTTEAVAWISSRSDPQACAFVLATLLVARSSESPAPPRGIVVALLAFLAGMAKETAVVLPALYLVDRAARGRPLRGDARVWLAIGVGVVSYLALYLGVRDRGITGQVDWYGGSFASHLPYALLGIGFQLKMLIWPSRFNFIHEPALFDPTDHAALALAATAIMVVAITLFRMRSRWREAAYGAAFYAIALLPAANLLLPLRSPLAERFAYLPLCGFALVVAAFAARLADRVKPRAVRFAIGGVVLAVAAFATHDRARAFVSPRALYAATLESWPDSYSAALGLGDAALRESRFDESRIAFERAVELARRAGDSKQLRRAEYALGRSRLLARDFVLAAAILESVVVAFERDPALAAELASIDADARHALATAYSLSFRLDDAAKTLDRLIERHGETADRLDARAEVERARAGDGNLVLDLLLRAIALDPDHAKARIHLAKFYHGLTGFEPEALRQLREVIARDPSNLEARALLDEFSK